MSRGMDLLETIWGLIATHTLLSISIKALDRLELDLGPYWPQIVELIELYDPTTLLTNPGFAVALLALLSVTILTLFRNRRKGVWR